MNQETITLAVGYNRKETMTFRTPDSLADMIRHCSLNGHIWFAANDGTARRCKINGKVRTWKRDTGRVEVPVKYGLREYATFYASDISRILIPVE
jgi:hypothetical protein